MKCLGGKRISYTCFFNNHIIAYLSRHSFREKKCLFRHISVPSKSLEPSLISLYSDRAIVYMTCIFKVYQYIQIEVNNVPVLPFSASDTVASLIAYTAKMFIFKCFKIFQICEDEHQNYLRNDHSEMPHLMQIYDTAMKFT